MAFQSGFSKWLFKISFKFQKPQIRRETPTQAQNKMQRAFLLNVVVCKRAAFFKLFASKNKALLIAWNAFFVLYLAFHHVNCVGAFDLQRNCFASQSLYKNLHAREGLKYHIFYGRYSAAFVHFYVYKKAPLSSFAMADTAVCVFTHKTYKKGDVKQMNLHRKLVEANAKIYSYDFLVEQIKKVGGTNLPLMTETNDLVKIYVDLMHGVALSEDLCLEFSQLKVGQKRSSRDW